jgi:hypothetical protein
VTAADGEQVLAAVRGRPRRLDLPVSGWTVRRLAAYLAEQTGIRVAYEPIRLHVQRAGIVLRRPQLTIPRPDPAYARKQRRLTTPATASNRALTSPTRTKVNVSWLAPLKAMGSPQAQQVLIPPPGQPRTPDGIGAVDDHWGQIRVVIRWRKRRREPAEWLDALLATHPTGTLSVAWDNASTHHDDEVEGGVRGAAGRLVLRSLPPSSPWRNPIAMRWRHFRRDVPPARCFRPSTRSLPPPPHAVDRSNPVPQQTLSIIGSHPAVIRERTWRSDNSHMWGRGVELAAVVKRQ